MKRILTFAAAVLLLMSTLILPAFAAPRFLDVETSYWGNSYIEFAATQGIINGYPSGDGRYYFLPENSVTREEAITMLYRALKSSGKLTSTEDFTSTYQKLLDQHRISSWSQSYVAYGLESGILEESELPDFVGAEGNGIAAPREQIAIWAARAMGELAAPVYSLPYTDLSSISAEALPYVDVLYRHGIMRGDDTGKFHPQAGVKRVEFAAVCNRIFDGIKAGVYQLDREQASFDGTLVSVDAARSQIRMLLPDGTAKTLLVHPKAQIVIDGAMATQGLAGIPAGTDCILAYGAFCKLENLDQQGESLQLQVQTGLAAQRGTITSILPLDSTHSILTVKNSSGDQIVYLQIDSTQVLGTLSENASVRFLADGVKLLELKAGL